MSADGFHAALLWRKLKAKFLLAYLKTLTNAKNSCRNPRQEACSGSKVADYDSKNCFKGNL
jgi:hypothetical protein